MRLAFVRSGRLRRSRRGNLARHSPNPIAGDRHVQGTETILMGSQTSGAAWTGISAVQPGRHRMPLVMTTDEPRTFVAHARSAKISFEWPLRP